MLMGQWCSESAQAVVTGIGVGGRWGVKKLTSQTVVDKRFANALTRTALLYGGLLFHAETA